MIQQILTLPWIVSLLWLVKNFFNMIRVKKQSLVVFIFWPQNTSNFVVSFTDFYLVPTLLGRLDLENAISKLNKVREKAHHLVLIMRYATAFTLFNALILTEIALLTVLKAMTDRRFDFNFNWEALTVVGVNDETHILTLLFQLRLQGEVVVGNSSWLVSWLIEAILAQAIEFDSMRGRLL